MYLIVHTATCAAPWPSCSSGACHAHINHGSILCYINHNHQRGLRLLPLSPVEVSFNLRLTSYPVSAGCHRVDMADMGKLDTLCRMEPRLKVSTSNHSTGSQLPAPFALSVAHPKVAWKRPHPDHWMGPRPAKTVDTMRKWNWGTRTPEVWS